MRDFWAGSWVLHYLSAKVCWKLAQKYGPDCLIYPSLFQQPLIDHWLREKWTDLGQWIREPSDRSLLTAGFPNVIVVLLPQDKVQAAMQTARETVLKEWLVLGKNVFQELDKRNWTRGLIEDSPTWQEWLRYQWQTYWTALPLNNKIDPLSWLVNGNSEAYTKWQDQLNRICQLKDSNELFKTEESQFIQAVTQENPDLTVNVGSWWCYLFDQLRLTAGTVKSSRNWRIPTSFYPRSTISGLGSVVYPQPENYRQRLAEDPQQRVTEADTRQYWLEQGGLFDGSEQLNATEVLKRGLHRILPELLFNNPNRKIPYYYPDLSSGVAGWLKSYPNKESDFIKACEAVKAQFPWTYSQRNNNDKRKPSEFPAILPWGIPWIDENRDLWLNTIPIIWLLIREINLIAGILFLRKFHNRRKTWPNPRLLNVGWLIDDFPLDTNETLQTEKNEEKELRNCIGKYFNQGNNPTDWYVIAAGDGDGMRQWLKGDKLKKYEDYIVFNQVISTSDSLNSNIRESFLNLTQIPKRMGPSSHNALSRALLDFSNRLVPYLTEERYAGRLIYSGGDDVLVYTNLWEWDNWLWDIRQCFKGEVDPIGLNELGESELPTIEFDNQGNYWRWLTENPSKSRPENIPDRPLFTLGKNASVSFGVVIAHHSVPLAIALENLWKAEGKEEGAKGYKAPDGKGKDAVQVRVLFGNGNILKSTAQFDVFYQWKQLIELKLSKPIEPSIFEQAAQIWQQHPAPHADAIKHWAIAFCQRRDVLIEQDRERFQNHLQQTLQKIYQTTPQDIDTQIKNWLKLAAFVLRNRNIKPQGGNSHD